MNYEPRQRWRSLLIGFILAAGIAACGVPIEVAEPTSAVTPQLDIGETPAPPVAAPTAAASPATVPGPATSGPAATPQASTSGCDGASNGTRLTPPSRVRPARAFNLLPVVPDPALDAAVTAALGDLAGSYGVVVKDLATGRGTAVNPDRVFYAASVFKVMVMYEAFNQAQQGILDLAGEVQVTPYYDAFGLGWRATSLCQKLPVQQAVAAMMSISDNAAAVLLQDLLGSNNINNSMQALGLKESRLLPEDLPLTAGDMAILLEGIGRGLAVDAASSEAMVRLMLAESIDNGIAAVLPPGTAVAHKTGNWWNATHDVAIVYSPKATYVLVVLTDRGYADAVTRAVSSAVYRYFNP